MFENFFNWPGRISLRKNVADSLVILRRFASYVTPDVPPIRQEQTAGRLYSRIDIDAEVESLDTVLKPGTDFADAFGPKKCPQSALRKWNVLHVLMHLRVEPVWHPWAEGHIIQQSTLWADAIVRAISQGTKIDAVDLEGNTPTRLALRSLFTFHVWQSALQQAEISISGFVENELAVCRGIVMDGWDEETLSLLLHVPTTKLYRHYAEWRETPDLFAFPDCSYDGLWVKCCWFQLLDILRHRTFLPPGWEILTAPRQFCRPRESIYWNPSMQILQKERPHGHAVLDTGLLREALYEGKDITGELSRMGVVWQ
jgi:hypothetical protein